MKEKNNRRKLSEIIRLAGLVAVFLLMVEYSRHFVRFDIQFERLIMPLALIFCFIVYKLFLILKSEGGDIQTIVQIRRKTTFVISLLILLLVLGGVIWILWKVGYFA